MSIRKFYCLLFPALVAAVVQCKQPFDKSSWDTDLLVPIANTTLTVNNLSADTSSIQKNSDGSVSLVYSQTLDSVSLSILDTFSIAPFERTARINSLVLDVPPYVQKVTLGQIAREFLASGNFLQVLIGSTIINGQGTIQTIPAITGLSIPATGLNFSQYFQTATLSQGNMQISLLNEFPLSLTGLQFNVTNKNSGTSLAAGTFGTVASGGSASQTYSLAGETVESDVDIGVSQLGFSAGTFLIDTNAYISFGVTFTNLQVSAATAIFPAQDVIKDSEVVALQNMGSLKLQKAVLQTGKVVMELISTLQDTTYISYKLPSATLNGVPLDFESAVPPAPPNGTTSVLFEANINGYTLDLTAQPLGINAVSYNFAGRIHYTGKLVSLSLQDSIRVRIYMQNVRPQYLQGYLGQLDTNFSGSVPVKLFSNVKSGSIQLSNANVGLSIENGFGMSGTINTKSLTAKNSFGSSLQLSDVGVVGVSLPVAPATETAPAQGFLPVTTLVQPAGNIADLVSLLPNQFSYSVNLSIGDSTQNLNQFAYSNSYVKTKLTAELPLKGTVNNLLLSDTSSFNITQSAGQISNGQLFLLGYNSFPVSVSVDLYFLDAKNNLLTSLIAPSPLAAAEVSAGGRTSGKQYSKVGYPFSNDQLNTILSASKVVFNVHLNTIGNVKIYDDYSLQLELVTEVTTHNN